MRVTMAILFGALSLAVAGCGGGGVDVPEGPMPQGGTFSGVWHSPQYGEMQMVQTGQNVVGEYVKDERRGRIQGTVRGNVMRFEWSENRELVAGRPIVTRGRGYFRYAIGEDGDHYVRGEWGHDDDMAGGGPWNAVRDRRQPSLSGRSESSSGGDDVEDFDSAGGGDSFDSADDSGGGSGASGGDDDALDLDGL